MEVAGANRRWRWPSRCRGSRRESAVAQLFSLDLIRIMYFIRAILICFLVVSLISGCGRSERVVHREGEPDVISVESEDAEMNAAILSIKTRGTSFGL